MNISQVTKEKTEREIKNGYTEKHYSITNYMKNDTTV
jgi:hypothetical protein